MALHRLKLTVVTILSCDIKNNRQENALLTHLRALQNKCLHLAAGADY